MIVTLSERAAERIRHLLVKQDRPEGAGLRLRVRGGGCSGLQYEMDLADAPDEGDHIAEQHGVRVFVDPKSAAFVESSHIDWESEIMGSRFRISNPQARASCSCGESFHA